MCRWVGGWWVAHKILVTSQRPNSPFSPYLGLTFRDLGLGLWTGTWPRACQFQHMITMRIHYTPSSLESDTMILLHNSVYYCLLFLLCLQSCSSCNLCRRICYVLRAEDEQNWGVGIKKEAEAVLKVHGIFVKKMWNKHLSKACLLLKRIKA